jgi:hypothetical protein
MYIGIKHGHIVIFNATVAGVELNASMRKITLDAIEQTDENIVPYYNTAVDGFCFKESEAPPTPAEVVNERMRIRRQGEYASCCDPLTAQIPSLRDGIANGDYADETERKAVEVEIARLHGERKALRAEIVAQFPYL